MKYFPDISQIGEIIACLNFDEDEYLEFIEENNLANNQNTLSNFIDEYCDFEVAFLDSETFHEFDTCDMNMNEIVSLFGEKMANAVKKGCMDGKEHRFEVLAYQDDIDLTKPEEINATAIKVLPNGEYFKGCRGFILTNGSVIYTEQEHNQCSRIPGVNGTFHFIKLGNIRVLDKSIDLAEYPTKEQFSILKNIVDCYSEEYLDIDLMNDKIGLCSKRYQYPDFSEISNDIYNYFLKKQKINNNIFNENKNMKKAQRINESQLRAIVTESVRKVLKEMDDFTPHGYKGISNLGGNEIQISDSGDTARLKFQDGEITDWLEIDFDEEGVAYVTTPYGQKEKLSDYMRY